jgi:uncharacterized membrane protein YdbT with pleckstrin-like domain
MEGDTMGYVENNLITGEQVTYRASLHWIVLFWPGVAAFFLGLPGLYWAFSGGFSKDPGVSGTMVLGIVLFIGAVLILGISMVRKRSAEIAVTNKRVIFKMGVIQRRTAEMFLQKIESVAVDQGLLARALNYGTVTLRGTGGSFEPFERVSHALEFRRQVQEQISRVGFTQEPKGG